MTEQATISRGDVNREVELTYRTLRRYGIPVNYGDATYLVARAHQRRSIDDLLKRIGSGKGADPWHGSHISGIIAREFKVEESVLREAIDELRSAIHPGDPTVTALRERIRHDPSTGTRRLSVLPMTSQMRRKLPFLEAAGIETLGSFACRAYEIAPVWTDAVLKALSISRQETPHDDDS